MYGVSLDAGRCRKVVGDAHISTLAALLFCTHPHIGLYKNRMQEPISINMRLKCGGPSLFCLLGSMFHI